MRNLRLLFLGIGLITGLSVDAQTANITTYGLEAGTSTVTSGSSYYGYQAGKTVNPATPAMNNTFIGHQAGKNITSGGYNTFIGYGAGINTTTSNTNTFIGISSGSYNNGNSNAGVGQNALSIPSSGSASSFSAALGVGAGQAVQGNNNTFVGYNAGIFANGSDNVMIGNRAGYSNYGSGPYTGSGNILIGNSAGSGMGLNNKLFIDNSSTTTPLIWGDFATDQLKLNGKTGIGLGTAAFPTLASGVNISAYNLFVKGGILTEEVRITLGSDWADYVFTKDYILKPLQEVEQFITTNGHLPNVPSAQKVKEEGIELGDMARIQQEKIEELTLYLIQQHKEIEAMKGQIKALTDKK